MVKLEYTLLNKTGVRDPIAIVILNGNCDIVVTQDCLEYILDKQKVSSIENETFSIEDPEGAFYRLCSKFPELKSVSCQQSHMGFETGDPQTSI